MLVSEYDYQEWIANYFETRANKGEGHITSFTGRNGIYYTCYFNQSNDYPVRLFKDPEMVGFKYEGTVPWIYY